LNSSQLLAISNFSKFIPLNLAGFKGIFACEIKQDANVLKIEVSLHQIRNISLFEKIAEGLNKNPESKNLADAIDKELIFSESISQMDAISVKHGFQQKLNEYSSVNQSDNIQMGQYVTLHGIIPNLNNLYLQYEHAYIIYGFFKFFIDNYDTIKMSFRHFGSEDIPQSIDDQVDDIVGVQTEEISVNVEASAQMEDTGSGIFLEMMGIIDSQALRVFIARNLFNKNWDLDTAVSLVNNDGNYTIKHHPIYDFNVWQYSEMHNRELVSILASIKEENSFELANKLKQVTKQIIYITLNENILMEQDKSKYIFTVSTGLFLLYIYSLKMMGMKYLDDVYTASTRNSSNYIQVVNYAFRYVLEKFNVNNTTIKSISIEMVDFDSEEATFDPINAKLDTIFEQYRYLASVDQNEFMNTVFSTLTSKNEESKIDASSVSKDLELSLGSPKVIDINAFIRDKSYSKEDLTADAIFKYEPSSMMDYADIPLNDLFKSNRIISYYYCQMLFLQYNGINRKLIDVPDYTSVVIRRYSDIIINKIFKEIDNNKLLATNATSAFTIYEHFIAPFIKNETILTFTSLTLIYQIAIPHIHNRYGVTKFIDNFH